MLSILDCTLRDGGYYTNWDFDEKLVNDYCRTMELSPIDYVEIGYRSIPLNGYLGRFFYCPVFVLQDLKKRMPSKKLAVILNEKDIRPKDVPNLLTPCMTYIDLVRIAVAPINFKRALLLARSVKSLGFKVAFNVMYMSTWKEHKDFLDLLKGLENEIDYFYMVDSYGGVFPEDVKEIVNMVKARTTVSLGFHGHNNLEMALANTLTAIRSGCSIVDATITGMGRGAGNLRTELLLAYLESREKLTLDYNNLSTIVAGFETLRAKYNWGTNLPYMFSGANSLPQKQVMEWVGMNRYSLDTIINALSNQKQEVNDNLKLPILKKESKFKEAILIGGGGSVDTNEKGISKLLEKSNTTCLIHSGLKHITKFRTTGATQYLVLSGFEGNRLLVSNESEEEFKGVCVFPPFPRKMGTIIPQQLKSSSFELEDIEFTTASSDSPLAIGVQTAVNLGAEKIYLAGFDGYDATIDRIQFVLAQENQEIINDAMNMKQIEITSLTPTKYKGIPIVSLYRYLS